MLRSTEELSLTAIARMKKSKLKYRLTTCKNNKEVVQYLEENMPAYKQFIALAG
jgi:hypothetical protein